MSNVTNNFYIRGNYIDKQIVLNDAQACSNVSEDCRETVGSDSAQPSPSPANDEPLFRYISPFVTDENERRHIHKVVVNLVRGDFGLQYICTMLRKMIADNQIALNVSQPEQYNELVRLGLPKDKPGFSYKNYENYAPSAKVK